VAIAILDYGSGNLHSVARAIAHVGGDPLVTASTEQVAGADALVIPGVGHFGTCVRALCHHGFDTSIRTFLDTGRPVFGVCVGMQVLLAGSEEDPEPGLGVLPGRAVRLRGSVKVPHMGWNTVTWTDPHPYVSDVADGTRFYFVHSFAPPVQEGVTVGVTKHGVAFSAAVARGQVFATQFHPEKSGEAGLGIYARFVEAVASR
jgi:imidazole glycerol-phosphate synthase subunit HisH